MWFKKEDTQKDRAVYIILDRSGSMANGWAETLGAINSYIKKLEDDVSVYVAAFDSDNGVDYKQLREDVASKVSPLTNADVEPRGMTPLYDAVGKCADKMLSDNAKRAVLVVMTDGYENSSREYSKDAIKAKLKALEAKDWPTVFLGANFDSVTSYATQTFGVAATNTINTTVRNRGATFDLYNAKTANYFAATACSAESVNSMKVTDEEKKKLDAEA